MHFLVFPKFKTLLRGMRGAETLIPARFLTLISHLCVVSTLLWDSHQTVRFCLPSQFHDNYLQIYHNRLVAGFSTAIALIVVELTTFMSGLTMFSSTVSLISIASHGSAAIALIYFMIDSWLCDWYWWIFATCAVFPFTTTNEHQQLTSSNEYRAGWSFYLVLAGVVTTLGSSLPVGYNIGVVNTPAEVIKSFCNESLITRYELHLDGRWLDVVWSCVVSTFIVGGCTGSILGAVLADRLGRKPATIVTSLLSACGALLFASCREANSVEMLIIGRLLVGLSGGLTTSIVPMYLTELAPLTLTGPMGTFCPMGVNVGVFVGQIMGLNFLLGGANQWPYLLSVYALLVIICVPVLFMLPESPKYLYVVKKNEETALKELSRLRGVSPSLLGEDIDLLKEEARAASELSSEESWGMGRVLLDKRLRLPLLLVCSMQAGQQTSGINAVFYYSQRIFEQAGLSEANAQYATICCGGINVLTAVAMLRLLPRAGRRPLLLWSVAAAAVTLAALAAAMRLMSVVTWMPYVCTVAVFLYVLSYGFGLGPIPYFIASEIFEVAPRPAGMAWGSLSNWAGNFLVGMCFPIMRGTIGLYSFLVFAAITTALYVFQRLYFPETRGKTPSQVTQLCSRGFSSRPLSSTYMEDNVAHHYSRPRDDL